MQWSGRRSFSRASCFHWIWSGPKSQWLLNRRGSKVLLIRTPLESNYTVTALSLYVPPHSLKLLFHPPVSCPPPVSPHTSTLSPAALLSSHPRLHPPSKLFRSAVPCLPLLLPIVLLRISSARVVVRRSIFIADPIFRIHLGKFCNVSQGR